MTNETQTETPSPTQSEDKNAFPGEQNLKFKEPPQMRMGCYARSIPYLYGELEQVGIEVGDCLPTHQNTKDNAVQLPTSTVIPPNQNGPGGLMETTVFTVEIPEHHTRRVVIAAPGPALPVQIFLQPDLNPNNPVYIVYVVMLTPFCCSPQHSKSIAHEQADFLAQTLKKILDTPDTELGQPSVKAATPAEVQALKRADAAAKVAGKIIVP